MKKRIPVWRKNQKLKRLSDLDRKGEPLTVEKQLKLWVAGKPVHNSTRDECCPDFSCCRPELLQPAEVRRKFARASAADRDVMLVGFLATLLQRSGHKVETSIS